MQLFGKRICLKIYSATQFVAAARNKEPQNLNSSLIKSKVMDTGKPKIMPLITKDFKDIHQDNSRRLCVISAQLSTVVIRLYHTPIYFIVSHSKNLCRFFTCFFKVFCTSYSFAELFSHCIMSCMIIKYLLVLHILLWHLCCI